MKLIFTEELPDKEGYYWYTNFGEHTPVVLEVTKAGRSFYAQNEEFCFQITKNKKRKLDEDEEYADVEGKYMYGDKLWCYIPNPFLPGGKEQVEPDCY